MVINVPCRLKQFKLTLMTLTLQSCVKNSYGWIQLSSIFFPSTGHTSKIKCQETNKENNMSSVLFYPKSPINFDAPVHFKHAKGFRGMEPDWHVTLVRSSVTSRSSSQTSESYHPLVWDDQWIFWHIFYFLFSYFSTVGNQ